VRAQQTMPVTVILSIRAAYDAERLIAHIPWCDPFAGAP